MTNRSQYLRKVTPFRDGMRPQTLSGLVTSAITEAGFFIWRRLMFDERLYAEKLKDPRWIAARRIILKRDDNTCQECGAKDTWGYIMQVHHITYIDGREPWEYPPDHLITLCKKCHKDAHNLEYIRPTRWDRGHVSQRIVKGIGDRI